VAALSPCTTVSGIHTSAVEALLSKALGEMEGEGLMDRDELLTVTLQEHAGSNTGHASPEFNVTAFFSGHQVSQFCVKRATLTASSLVLLKL
jgi:hypothetical protein